MDNFDILRRTRPAAPLATTRRRDAAMHRVWRYVESSRHGWYLDDGEIVLDAAEQDAWPGVFMAFLRRRGLEVSQLEFVSLDERVEFLADVMGSRPDAAWGRSRP